MIAVQSAAQALAALAVHPQAVAKVQPPTSLGELRFSFEGESVYWNGHDARRRDFLLDRWFRVTCGPLPTRYAYHHDEDAARTAESRARWKVCAEILRACIGFDTQLSYAAFPDLPVTSKGETVLDASRRQRQEISDAVSDLLKHFVRGFYEQLPAWKGDVSFTALEVVEWIDAFTELQCARVVAA